MRRLALAVLFAFPLFGGTLVPAGTLQIERAGLDAALLPDGRVLVAGGNAETRQFEIFDPAAQTSLVGGETPLPLSRPRVTALQDGAIITGGGYRTDGRPVFGHYGDRFVGKYDESGFRGETAALNDARNSHTATALPDGRVLIVGGVETDIGGFHIYRIYSDSVEIFDPATGTARIVARLHEARGGHTATLLFDGSVLIAGGSGRTSEGEVALQTVEIFRPATNTIERGGTMLEARSSHTATLLANGRVLLAGGTYEDPSAEIYDPLVKTFTRAGYVGKRIGHTATLLRNGRVFIAGGEYERQAVVYDPVLDWVVEWYDTDGFNGHDAVLLKDGSVLLIGGQITGEGRLTRVLRFVPDGPSRRRAIRR